jgi:hypothetical protein
MHATITIKLKVLKNIFLFIDGPCKYYTQCNSDLSLILKEIIVVFLCSSTPATMPNFKFGILKPKYPFYEVQQID